MTKRQAQEDTSALMRRFYKARFAHHEQVDVNRLDVLHWWDTLSGHASIPPEERWSAATLIESFRTGTVLGNPFYPFLIRAALSHYFSVPEFMALSNTARELALEILEKKITIRCAAKQLGMTPHQLAACLNGHAPISYELDQAMDRLLDDVSNQSVEDMCDDCRQLQEEVDFLDIDPESDLDEFYGELNYIEVSRNGNGNRTILDDPEQILEEMEESEE